MNLSFWEKDIFIQRPQYLVIGAGLVGMNAAIFLRQKDPSADVLVIDSRPFPGQASLRNAGFACFGSMTELLADEAENGMDAMLSLVEKRWRGLQNMLTRLERQRIDFQPLGGLELFQAKDEETYQNCANHLERINRHLGEITGLEQCFSLYPEGISQNGLGRSRHLIRNQAEGQLHPGKMMAAWYDLAREAGVRFLFGLRVESIVAGGPQVDVQTDQLGVLKAEKVLVATNGLTNQFFPQKGLTAVRNQVLLTTAVPNLQLSGSFHYREGYVYFRNVGNRVLLGGARDVDVPTETTDEFGFTDVVQSDLYQLMNEVILPNQAWAIEHQWSGILGMGPQKSPIIQSPLPGVYLAVRLGGMGVAIGSLVGEEVARLMLGEKDGINQAIDSFNP
ncbi:MAG: FAD-binding oxidoreductase [Bacteroidota bacterium]